MSVLMWSSVLLAAVGFAGLGLAVVSMWGD